MQIAPDLTGEGAYMHEFYFPLSQVSIEGNNLPYFWVPFLSTSMAVVSNML